MIQYEQTFFVYKEKGKSSLHFIERKIEVIAQVYHDSELITFSQ